MALLQFIGEFLKFIRDLLWPIFIVSEPNRAVRYTNGQAKALGWPFRVAGPVLEPGWYFSIPFFQEIRQTNCAEDCIDVANLPITTRDDVQVTVSYNLRYRITDVLKYQLNLHHKDSDDSPSAIHAEAAVEVAMRMRRRSWERLFRSQGAIERRITKSIAERFENWGITASHGGMTICAKALPLSMIHVN
jgi:regulator of protease activity HflC (stomatin/prohibitin superfamily)